MLFLAASMTALPNGRTRKGNSHVHLTASEDNRQVVLFHKRKDNGGSKGLNDNMMVVLVPAWSANENLSQIWKFQRFLDQFVQSTACTKR